MPHQALSENDKRLLALARWLIRRVVDRHPHEVTSYVVVHMAAAIHGIDLVEKDLDQ